jgi:transcriptional regulator with XRE-family HTH domain
MINEAEYADLIQEQVDLIVQRLTRARENAGLSQSQAARLLGFTGTPSSISQYETGRSTPNLTLFLKMCEVYDVSPTWALTGVNPNFDSEVYLAKAQGVTRMATSELLGLIALLETLRQDGE